MRPPSRQTIAVVIAIVACVLSVLLKPSEPYVTTPEPGVPPTRRGTGERLSYGTEPRRDPLYKPLPTLPKILRTPNPVYTMSLQNGMLDLRIELDPYRPQIGGSCTGHAVAQCLRMTLWRYSCNSSASCGQWLNPPKPCPYWIWFVARCSGKLLSSCLGNYGGEISKALRRVAAVGWIWENDWKVNGVPIGDTRHPWTFSPPEAMYEIATKIHRQYLLKPFTIVPVAIQQFTRVLQSGHAIVVGVRVGQERLGTSLRTFGSDVVQTFDSFVKPSRGGHAMLIFGYKRAGGHVLFHVLNSWGRQKQAAYFTYDDLVARNVQAWTLTWN